MSALRQIQAKCGACAGPLPVRVGHKYDTRTVRCATCGERWAYSCWTLETTPTATIDKVEMVRAAEVLS